MSKIGVRSSLAPGTTSAVQKQTSGLEEEIFRLKLQWIMAKNDEDKRRISDEIRRKLGLTQKKE
ncbi:MAG TPA: hypothetical protein VE955_03670 [Candidatus Dormibacteraeota bacterium]|nr:hypothetical protein [Candidatus Dormibacteraeota bacterium]